jgi:hypothetical protein
MVKMAAVPFFVLAWLLHASAQQPRRICAYNAPLDSYCTINATSQDIVGLAKDVFRIVSANLSWAEGEDYEFYCMGERLLREGFDSDCFIEIGGLKSTVDHLQGFIPLSQRKCCGDRVR